jgi:hypothetical protein
MKVTGNAALAGAVTLTQQLILENGTLSIGDHNLVAEAVSGGTASSYVRTDGAGMFSIKPAASTFFPVGNGTYNPLSIAGESIGWQVRVTDALPGGAPFLTVAALQRSWEVRPDVPPASGATIVFEYDGTDPMQSGTAFNNLAPVDIWTYQQPVWTRVLTGQVPAATGSGRKTVTVAGWKEASAFSIANDPHPLPVRFSGFRAVPQSASIDLAFRNEAETDVLRYILERSPNGKDFFSLVTIGPVANNGRAANYSVTDKQPYPAYNFYRVRGIETNGKSYVTHIIRASTIRSGRILSVLPNPVREGRLQWEATLPDRRSGCIGSSIPAAPLIIQWLVRQARHLASIYCNCETMKNNCSNGS